MRRIADSTTVKKQPSFVNPSLTLLDGTTYVKEFSPWVKSSEVKNNFSNEDKTPSNHNVYYETLKPIFIFLTFAGILPVFKMRIGSHKVQVLLVGGICLAVYIGFGILTYHVTERIVDLIFHDDDFSSIVLQVIIMLLLMQHWFYLILTWPESFAVNRYFSQWETFQIHYESVTKSRLVLTCQRKMVVVLVAAIMVSLLFPYMVDTDHDNVEFGNTTNLVLSYHLMILLSFYILWFSNSWAICQAADQFNDRLTQACLSDISAARLEEYRLVWLRLSELVRAGSSMLSYTMALIVTTPFAYEIIASYNLTMFVIRSLQSGGANDAEARNAVNTAGIFTFYAILLALFCNAGHWMTVKCEKTQDVLLSHNPRLPESLTKVNSEYMYNLPFQASLRGNPLNSNLEQHIGFEEHIRILKRIFKANQYIKPMSQGGNIRLFLRCLRSVPPNATLSGYVIINRKVFLHMTGVLITYLIILVQFNISSINPRSAASPVLTAVTAT